MRRLAFTTIACFSLMTLAALSTAAQFVMSEEAVESLSEVAAEAYKAGQKDADHIRYDEALANYLDAMRLDPEHVEIRHLVNRLAQRQARLKSGKSAVQQMRIAQQACEEILGLKGQGATSEDLRRANDSLERVESAIRGQAERDLRRQEMGAIILKQQAHDIRNTIEERRKRDKQRRAEDRKNRSQDAESRGQGMGGARGGGGGMGMDMGMGRGGG